MEKINNRSNLKLKVTALVLSFVLLAAVGALVGVFAASTQGLSSSFSVSYTLGNNLAARVRTEKYVPNLDTDGDGVEDGAVNIIYDSNENEIERDAQDYVVFNANDNTSEKDVYIGEVNLNPYASKAYFYFTIESLMDSGYIRVLCTPTYNEDRKNIDADIAYCNIDDNAGFDAAQSASTISEDDWTKAHYNNIPAGGYKMIRVGLSVHDVNKTAKCGGTFDIQLDYSTVTGLEALDDTTKSTIQSNTTAEQIIFAYAEEQPEGAAQTNAAKPMADTTKKIWTRLDGTTLYVYSNYTIDLPADCTSFFQGKSELKSLDLTNFNTSNVTTMEKMFASCAGLSSIDLSNFNTANVKSMFGMFGGCVSLTKISISNFDTSSVTTMAQMFMQCSGLVDVDLSNFNNAQVTDMSYMFYECVALKNLNFSAFNTGNVVDMRGMFAYCEAMQSLDLSSFDTKNVKSMFGMFASCLTLSFVEASSFDTGNVTDMSAMFQSCEKLTYVNVSNWNTLNVQDMGNMFAYCKKLENLDVSNWSTSNVTNMSYMFHYCIVLSEIDVSNFNTEQVKRMDYMFFDCANVKELDLSKWNTPLVENMHFMFGYCNKLTYLDLSNFNTEKVTNMAAMFGHCTALEKIFISDKWNTDAVTNSGSMFINCSLLPNYKANYIDKTYAYAGGDGLGYMTFKNV
ncbi:MAG: BspA family leucine-rich repeat surface protein [Clostridia bacterium]|nr:BspA family leucine-rich repeat surface protein [Clostridia bacterium]